MNAYSSRMQAAPHAYSVEPLRIADALVQLKASHRLIEEQFEIYSRTTHFVKKQICLETIFTSVTVHITLLTFYFHPAVMSVFENPAEFARQSIVKYAKFKVLLSELEQSASALERDEKLKELEKHFQQHVRDEETAIFPKLRKSPLNLPELGETLHRAKQQLECEIHAQAAKKSGLLMEKAPLRQHAATLLRH